MKNAFLREFQTLLKKTGRPGIIGFAPVDSVKLIPEQKEYLSKKLKGLGNWSNISAASIGLLYHEAEILSIPDDWNVYARAYTELNRSLEMIGRELAAKFGGRLEKPTIEGSIDKVGHVDEYFPHCVSHRAFAEAAMLGWRGRHGLIVTLEAGPALRFATIFIPERILPDKKKLTGCKSCRACLKVCPILKENNDYREKCRIYIRDLKLDDEVCGLCVRTCWGVIKKKRIETVIF